MKKVVIIFSILFLITVAFSPSMLLAEGATSNEGANASGGVSVSLDNPLGDATPQSLMGNVINAILGIIGSLALLMFIFGGITWMTSSGNPEKVQKGRGILIWATIGLAVIFFSYALVNFVIFDIIGG